MKILGGNFGVKGSASISSDNKLVIDGARRVVYSPEQVESVSANQSKERKFGIFGFLVGAIFLSIILGMFLGIVGIVIALVVAIFGSFYSETNNLVEVRFDDSKTVTLECTNRGVKKLVQFGPA